jgi:hypothetical protein
MQLTDLDTSTYLADFKEKYLNPIEKKYQYYMNFKELPEKEKADADKNEKNYIFLTAFVASVEATLEQNMALKINQKS